jgi:hypothetical protein
VSLGERAPRVGAGHLAVHVSMFWVATAGARCLYPEPRKAPSYLNMSRRTGVLEFGSV